MPANYEFILSGGLADARERVAQILRSNGFAVDDHGADLVAHRGSANRTLLLGSLAGKATYMRFGVNFSQGDGTVIARLHREAAAGALRGGVLGAATTASVFDELARRIGAALEASA